MKRIMPMPLEHPVSGRYVRFLPTRSLSDVGSTVEEKLKNDLALELQVAGDLRKVMTFCESVQDYQTREILKRC